jgi:ABC-type multidrug transport system ATPase subunit
MKTLSFRDIKIGRNRDRILLDVESTRGDPQLGPGLHLIVAPNGKGKTTLLQTIAGLLPRLSGDFWFGEKTLNPEKDVLYVSEYLTFPKYVYPAEWISFVARKPVNLNQGPIVQWVEGLSLQSKVKSYMGRMSQGERRKVTWLAAQESDRSILLLDEPLDGLDLLAIRAARALIQEWRKRGRIIIVVAHQVAEMLDLADSVLLIRNQKLLDWKKVMKDDPAKVDPHSFRARVLEFYSELGEKR